MSYDALELRRLVTRRRSLRPNVPLRVVHADGGVLTGARVVLVGEAVLVVEVPPLGVDQVLRGPPARSWR